MMLILWNRREQSSTGHEDGEIFRFRRRRPSVRLRQSTVKNVLLPPEHPSSSVLHRAAVADCDGEISV